MKSRSPSFLALLPALLVAGSAFVAQAQVTTGSVTFVVTDRVNGEPLAGASVTLESTALFQPRVYKSDDKGQIQAVLLPVGNYKAKVSKSGYRQVSVSEMRVGLGVKLMQSVSLAQLDAALSQDTVTVIAASGDVDGGTDYAE
jgi:hypothetical protein